MLKQTDPHSRQSFFRKAIMFGALLTFAHGLGTEAFAQQKKSKMPPRPMPPEIAQNMGKHGAAKIPFLFERNMGQADPRAAFLVRRSGYNVFLTKTGLVTVLSGITDTPRRSEYPAAPPPAKPGEKDFALHMQLVGASERLKIEGLQESSTRAGYFSGNTPSAWVRDVPMFKGVQYSGIYRGTDMLVESDGGRLRYHFMLNPKANPQRIRMRFTGIKSADIDDQGRLALTLGNGRTVLHHAPQVFEIDGKKRRQLKAGFELVTRDTVGFRIPRRTPGTSLLIDPEIDFSTYFGGSGAEPIRMGILANNQLRVPALDTDLDALQRLLIGGTTMSADLPDAAGPINPAPFMGYAARVDANSSGAPGWDYVSYVGGSGDTMGFGITAGADETAYLCGTTNSHDLPQPGASFDSDFDTGAVTSFIMQFNTDGQPVAGTFVDPTHNTNVFACEYNHALSSGGRYGSVHVTGQTAFIQEGMDLKADYFRADAFQNTIGGNTQFSDAFVGAFSANLSTLEYFTLYGGSFSDAAIDISVRDGEAFITGITESYDLPLSDDAASDHTLPDDLAESCVEYFNTFRCYESFVVRFKNDGSDFIYATMLGDDGFDAGQAIAVDRDAFAYVAGFTDRGSFGSNAYVTKISPNGGSFIYRSLFAAIDAIAYDINVDSYGNAYTVGELRIGGQATPDAISTNFLGGDRDGFYAVLDTNGQVVYLTHLGGEADDHAYALAMDNSGCAYIGLETWSDNLNVSLAGAPQNARAGASDVLIMRHCNPPDYDAMTIAKVALQGILEAGDTAQFRITIDNPGQTIPGPIVITDPVPLPLQAVSVAGPGCVLDGQTVTCTLNSIPHGVTGILVESINRLECVKYEDVIETRNVAHFDFPNGTRRTVTVPVVVRDCGETLYDFCNSGEQDCNPDQVCYQACAQTVSCIFGSGAWCIGRIENYAYGPRMCVRDPLMGGCDRIFP